jgi:hypothetical protein
MRQSASSVRNLQAKATKAASRNARPGLRGQKTVRALVGADESPDALSMFRILTFNHCAPQLEHLELDGARGDRSRSRGGGPTEARAPTIGEYGTRPSNHWFGRVARSRRADLNVDPSRGGKGTTRRLQGGGRLESQLRVARRSVDCRGVLVGYCASAVPSIHKGSWQETLAVVATARIFELCVTTTLLLWLGLIGYALVEVWRLLR